MNQMINNNEQLRGNIEKWRNELLFNFYYKIEFAINLTFYSLYVLNYNFDSKFVIGGLKFSLSIYIFAPIDLKHLVQLKYFHWLNVFQRFVLR